MRIAVLGVVAATAAATLIIFAPASRNNYPGGMALRLLHDDWGYAHGKPAVVHLDDLTCTTGASRFGEELINESWTYDKRDGLLDYDEFDFRIAELPVVDETFDVVATVEAFSGLKIDLKKIPFLHATTAPRIVLQRAAARPPPPRRSWLTIASQPPKARLRLRAAGCPRQLSEPARHRC